MMARNGSQRFFEHFRQTAWKRVSFDSRFLTDFNVKCSINDLELLALLRVIESRKNICTKQILKSSLITETMTRILKKAL